MTTVTLLLLLLLFADVVASPLGCHERTKEFSLTRSQLLGGKREEDVYVDQQGNFVVL
jgi:hypothetical protein